MVQFDEPLVLRGMGSFFAGGRRLTVEGKPVRTIDVNAKVGRKIVVDPNGDYNVEHAYVQYFLPQNEKGRFPLLFWHGGGMTGKAWETTPDGRPGWRDYFLHLGWSVYICDAVERGRSGWAPEDELFSQEAPTLFPMHYAFERFRLGASYASRETYPHSRFPMNSYEEYVSQFVPRWTGTSEATVAAYGALLEKTGPAVVIGHSQGATLSFSVMRTMPERFKALVAVEPYGTASDEDIDLIKDIPILWVLGDFMDLHPAWKESRAKVIACHEKICAAGGNSTLLDLPAEGILGNSHMLMMETNNFDIAERIQSWFKNNNLC